MRARAATSILLAGIIAAVLAGCGFVTPIATQYQYDPGDGVSGRVGEVTVRNALILTEDGRDGNLLLTAINGADENVVLRLQYEVDGAKVDAELQLDAGTITDFGFGESGQLLLAGIDAPAGSLFTIYLQYGSEVGAEIRVPVLDGELAQYSPFLPTPVPTPTDTEAATPQPGDPEADAEETDEP